MTKSFEAALLKESYARASRPKRCDVAPSERVNHRVARCAAHEPITQQVGGVRWFGVTLREANVNHEIAASAGRTAVSAKEESDVGRIGDWEWTVDAGFRLSKDALKILARPERRVDVGTDDLLRSLHPIDRGVLHAALMRSARQGKSFAIDLRTGEGDPVRWIAWRGMHAPGGSAEAKVSGTIQEVTDRKRLESVHARLLSVFDAADQPIIGFDEWFNVMDWNGAAADSFGFAPPAVQGRPLLGLVPLGRQREMLSLMERCRRGEQIPDAPMGFLDSQGSEWETRIKLVPVLDFRGHVAGGFLLIRTPHLLPVAAPTSNGGDLERTMRMNAERLQLLRFLAEELRTCMTPLVLDFESFGKALQQLEPPTAELLERCRRNVLRMRRTVDDLFESARLRAQRVQVQRVQVELRSTASEAIRAVRKVLGKRMPRVVFSAPEALTVQADPRRLRHALEGLLYASFAGFSRETIQVAVRRTGKDVRLTIDAPRPCMTPEQVSAIVAPIPQIPSGALVAAASTELGVHVARILLEACGARVSYAMRGKESGSTVTVSFPADGGAPG
jgi:PAS domain S-box-containing protein